MSVAQLAPALILMAIAIFGIVLLQISNREYYRRTRDPAFVGRFWLYRHLLTRREYLMNRTGFWLSVLSLLGIFALLVLLQ